MSRVRVRTRWRVLEDAGHFVVALDEELVAVELHAGGVANGFAGLDAEHDVLGVGVVFAEIVAVVGGDQRQAEIFFQLEEAGMDAVLHFQALILNLEIEILFAENVGEGSGGGASGVVIVLHEALGDFALQAAGEADEPAGMLGEKLLADARLVVEAVQRGLGGDLDQVAVALFVFGEDEQVVVGVAFGGGAVVVLFADVEFAADDGLHARVLGGVDEMHGAKNVAVVGHGHGGHPHFLHALAELFDVTRAVEHGVVGVQVQVNELGHGSVKLVYRSGSGGKVFVSVVFVFWEPARGSSMSVMGTFRQLRAGHAWSHGGESLPQAFDPHLQSMPWDSLLHDHDVPTPRTPRPVPWKVTSNTVAFS